MATSSKTLQRCQLLNEIQQERSSVNFTVEDYWATEAKHSDHAHLQVSDSRDNNLLLFYYSELVFLVRVPNISILLGAYTRT